MKRLLIPFIALVLCPPAQAWPWGKYPSRAEASQACWKWAEKNSFELIIQGRRREESFSSFVCGAEEETKQFLAQEVSRVMWHKQELPVVRVTAAEVRCEPTHEFGNLDGLCRTLHQMGSGEVLKRFRW